MVADTLISQQWEVCIAIARSSILWSRARVQKLGGTLLGLPIQISSYLLEIDIIATKRTNIARTPISSHDGKNSLEPTRSWGVVIYDVRVAVILCSILVVWPATVSIVFSLL
jgi:hypothetical protein